MLLDMFTSFLGGWQAKLAIAAVVVAAFTYLYFDNQALKARQETHMQQIQTLQDTINQEKQVRQQIQESINQQLKINENLGQQWSSLDNQITNLNSTILSVVINGQKTDLRKAAVSQPSAAQDKLNQATRSLLRCNEIATGSPILPGDIDNPSCPELTKQVKNDAENIK